MIYHLFPNPNHHRKEYRNTGNYSCTFMLTGDIDGGIPNFQLPFFSIPANETGHGEPAEDIGFGEMVQELGAAIIIIPIIAILESIAIAKAFCKFQWLVCWSSVPIFSWW